MNERKIITLENGTTPKNDKVEIRYRYDEKISADGSKGSCKYKTYALDDMPWKMFICFKSELQLDCVEMEMKVLDKYLKLTEL